MNIESEKIILYSREKHVKDNRRAFALKERGTTEALIYAKKKTIIPRCGSHALSTRDESADRGPSASSRARDY